MADVGRAADTPLVANFRDDTAIVEKARHRRPKQVRQKSWYFLGVQAGQQRVLGVRQASKLNDLW